MLDAQESKDGEKGKDEEKFLENPQLDSNNW